MKKSMRIVVLLAGLMGCLSQVLNAAVIYENNGNFGIGTTSPVTALHVLGRGPDGSNAISLDCPSATHLQYMLMHDGVLQSIYGLSPSTGGGYVSGSGANSTVMGSYINASTHLIANKSIKATIMPNGNIGIGTTNPQSTIHVNTDSYPSVSLQRTVETTPGYFEVVSSKGAAGARFGMETQSGSTVANGTAGNSTVAGSWNSAPFHLIAGREVKATILPNGHLGIGTTSPATAIHVLGRGPDGSNAISLDCPSKTHLQYMLMHDGVLQSIYGLSPSTGGGYVSGSGANSTVMGSYINASTHLIANQGIKATILPNGNFGIGTTAPTALLDVAGSIKASDILLSVNSWADYVFEKNYALRPLSEVEAYIKANKHLPDVPSEDEVKKNGISVLEMNVILLRKVEELTLYAIELKAKTDALEKRLEVLEKR